MLQNDKFKKSERNCKFMSFEEVVNKLNEKKSKGEGKLREDAKKVNRPISSATKDDMFKYIEYGTNLIRKEYPEMCILLRLRNRGATHEEISNEFKVPKRVVIELEKKAILRVKDAIDKKQRGNDIPIIGG